jgi:class 3 adenylate cyclase
MLADGGETGVEADLDERESDDVDVALEGRGRQVLIVDDLEDMRNLVGSALESRGYRVLRAVNGAQGYDKICERKPDLVISDWMMPKLSGPGMLEKVRANPDVAGTPVVLLTAKSDAESKMIGTEIGADAFLGKPFNDQELASTVRNLLGLKAREKEVEELNEYITESVLKRYLPPPLISDILSGKLHMDKPAELRDITILFSDLKGFTSISEKLGPEGISRVLNEYLSEMNKVIFEHGGTIDKFIGDAIMVLFGAPQDMSPSEQAAQATECAKAMQVTMGSFTKNWEDDGASHLKMRIGIHHGQAVVGNFGSTQRSDYTAIGPAVNFASRIESASSAGEVFVSEAVAGLLDTHVTEAVGAFDLKGIDGAQTLYRVG